MATQQEIATHLGLSLKGARNMLARLQMDNKTYSLESIRKIYISSLDDIGASRSGQINVTRERVKLMQAQRVKLRLETKVLRGTEESSAGGNSAKKKNDSKERASIAVNAEIKGFNRLINILSFSDA